MCQQCDLFVSLSLAPDCVCYNFTCREEEDCYCQQPSSGQALNFASPCDAVMSPEMQVFQYHGPHLQSWSTLNSRRVPEHT